MVMPEPSYVKLEPEKTKRLKLDKWWWEDRQVTDPKSRIKKTVKAMVFHVTEEDGKPVDKTYSAIAFKLQQTLAPLVESGVIFTRRVDLTWYPSDYATEYGVALV